MVDLMLHTKQSHTELQLATAGDLVHIIAPHDGVGGLQWSMRVDSGSPIIVDVERVSPLADVPEAERPIGGGVNRIFSLRVTSDCVLSFLLAQPWGPREVQSVLEVALLVPSTTN